MPYNFKTAMEVLSEADQKRMVAVYLNSDIPPSQTNWTKASEEFGAASIESMKVMLRTALKKIEAAGGKEDADGTPVKATPRKRKGEGREDTPIKKPKKSPKAAKTTAASDDAVDEEAATEVNEQKDEGVKEEEDD